MWLCGVVLPEEQHSHVQCIYIQVWLTLWQGLVQAAAAQSPGLFLISVMDSLANSPFMAPTHMQKRHKCSNFWTMVVQNKSLLTITAPAHAQDSLNVTRCSWQYQVDCC